MAELSLVLGLVVIILLGTLLIMVWQLKGSDSGKRMESRMEMTERIIREEFQRSREESTNLAGQGRQEMSDSIQTFRGSLTESLDKVKDKVEERLASIQKDNGAKLDLMRETVDEKLHATLEKRLGESFKIVSDRLEQVHQGLGEMQTLASEVGNLRKVMTNVKTRGTWGEYQLENLLEELLTPEQFERNFSPKPGSRESVEFAIRFPGRGGKNDAVWIPVDSKFPLEDYQRLVQAEEEGDRESVQKARSQLESRVKHEARSIRDKYLNPPRTTEFGIMYLPVESLYAEVLRIPGLLETLQRDYRVTLCGPSNMAAFLNSLQMGFRTLAIEKRSSEVWNLLAAVKTEFGRFGDILDKTRQKLDASSKELEKAASKSRTIERKLGKVQEMPITQDKSILGNENSQDDETLDESLEGDA